MELPKGKNAGATRRTAPEDETIKIFHFDEISIGISLGETVVVSLLHLAYEIARVLPGDGVDRASAEPRPRQSRTQRSQLPSKRDQDLKLWRTDLVVITAACVGFIHKTSKFRDVSTTQSIHSLAYSPSLRNNVPIALPELKTIARFVEDGPPFQLAVVISQRFNASLQPARNIRQRQGFPPNHL